MEEDTIDAYAEVPTGADCNSSEAGRDGGRVSSTTGSDRTPRWGIAPPHREEHEISSRHCFYLLRRAPAPAFRQPLPIDPDVGEAEPVRRCVVVVQALRCVQDLRPVQSEIRLQVGKQIREVRVGRLVEADVPCDVDRIEFDPDFRVEAAMPSRCTLDRMTSW